MIWRTLRFVTASSLSISFFDGDRATFPYRNKSALCPSWSLLLLIKYKLLLLCAPGMNERRYREIHETRITAWCFFSFGIPSTSDWMQTRTAFPPLPWFISMNRLIAALLTRGWSKADGSNDSRMSAVPIRRLDEGPRWDAVRWKSKWPMIHFVGHIKPFTVKCLCLSDFERNISIIRVPQKILRYLFKSFS